MNFAPHAADSRQIESTATSAERLLTFHEVYSLLGYNCRTGHTARALAARGQIKAIRLSPRVIRYGEASVRALIAGGVA